MEIIRKFMNFAGVGVIGTGAHYMVLVLLLELSDTPLLLGTTIGFTIGALVNYKLNYHYTFKSNKRHHETIVKFFIIAFFGMLINSLIVWAIADKLAWHYMLAQIIATSFVLLVNFTANLLWTFSEKPYVSTK